MSWPDRRDPGTEQELAPGRIGEGLLLGTLAGETIAVRDGEAWFSGRR